MHKSHIRTDLGGDDGLGVVIQQEGHNEASIALHTPTAQQRLQHLPTDQVRGPTESPALRACRSVRCPCRPPCAAACGRVCLPWTRGRAKLRRGIVPKGGAQPVDLWGACMHGP